MSQQDYAVASDYMKMLEEAAMGYLQRHQGEHLRDQELFERTVNHLVTALAAIPPLAENAVARAYGKLRTGEDQRYLDITQSTAQMAMLVDPKTGMTYTVPVRWIFQQMIDPKPTTVVH